MWTHVKYLKIKSQTLTLLFNQTWVKKPLFILYKYTKPSRNKHLFLINYSDRQKKDQVQELILFQYNSITATVSYTQENQLIPLAELFLQLYPNKESCSPQICLYLTFLVLWATVSEAVTHERGKSDCEALCFDASHWLGFSEPREIHIEMYWNKQTRNKPEAKKRGFYILIILWFWFLPRIAAIQWNPASTQVTEEMCKWPSSIRLKPFKHEESLLEAKNQRSSLLCWCKSPLPWEQPLILGRAVPARDVSRPLLSGVALAVPGSRCGTMIRYSCSTVTPLKGRTPTHGARADNSNWRSSALLWVKLKTTESKAQQSLHSGRALLSNSVHTSTRLTAG